MSFINKLAAIVMIFGVANAIARVPTQSDTSSTTRGTVPCMIQVSSSEWVNANAVDYIRIEEKKTPLNRIGIAWYFGREMVFVETPDYRSIVEQYIAEVSKKCK